MDNVSKRSGDLFFSGWFCAESVLIAMAESRGIDSELIPKVASGFCAGIARTSQMCGAVSGAIMAIGLVLGRKSTDEPMDPIYVAVRELLKTFEEKFDSTNCAELTGCDLATPEGQEQFKKNNMKDKCRRLVEEATAMALSLTNER